MSMTGSWGKSSHSQWSNCLEARWAKSSYSGALNCLEAQWAKSSYTGINGPHCVEAQQPEPKVVQVRDSKAGEASPILEFSPGAWMEFIEGVKADRELAQVLGE